MENCKAKIAPNKRVQGTRHKVSGPLTRDVGSITMKILRLIAAIILTTTMHVAYAADAEATTNTVPLSHERVWTMDGKQMKNLNYQGIVVRKGITIAVFNANGLGPRVCQLDKMSPEDIEIIKEYERIRAERKNHK